MMPFINWGEETPEQKRARLRFEEEQMMFILEQRAANAATASAAAAAAGSGGASKNLTLTYYNENGPFTPDQINFVTQNKSLNIKVDWGDGSSSEYYLDPWESVGASHQYVSAGEYIVTVKLDSPENLSDIEIYGQDVVSISGIDSLTGLKTLYMYDTSITDIFSNNKLPNSLLSLNLSNNQYLTNLDFTGRLPNNIAIVYVDSQYSQISVTLDPIPPTMTGFHVQGPLDQPLSSLTLGSDLPSTLYELSIVGCDFTKFEYAIPTSLYAISIREGNLNLFNPTIPTGSNLEFIDLYNNELTSFTTNLSNCTSLNELRLSNNQITLFNPSAPLPNNLISLYLSNNQLSSFNLTHPLNSNLEYIYLDHNQLTSFNYIQPLPNGLRRLDLGYNQFSEFTYGGTWPSQQFNALLLENNLITNFNPGSPLDRNDINSQFNTLSLSNNPMTTFNPTHPLSRGLRNLYLDNCNQLTSVTLNFRGSPPNIVNLVYYTFFNSRLSTSQVNAALVSINNATAIRIQPSPFIDLRQSPAAPPSGAGLTAKTALQARGFTVFTN